MDCAGDSHCTLGDASECQISIQSLNTVTVITRGADDEIKAARRHFGKQLKAVADIIGYVEPTSAFTAPLTAWSSRNRIPDDERILMFSSTLFRITTRPSFQLREPHNNRAKKSLNSKISSQGEGSSSPPEDECASRAWVYTFRH